MVKPAAGRGWQPYAAYRDSGVEWLGPVPAHWPLRRLKYLAAIRPSNVDKHSVEGQTEIRLCNYIDVYNNDRIADGLDFMRATATDEQIRTFELRADDVLITKDSETWTDIAVPAHVPLDLPGVVCGYHLALLRPRAQHLRGDYLFWLLASRRINHQFAIAANGITRFGLSTDAITGAWLPCPDVAEQRAITAFLDRETARIDALVEKKQRLIALLREKRQAVITRAVTRGLDPNVPMKDSGVEWLGEVPAHWGVLRTKFVARLESGHTPSRQHPEYWVDCTIPWFSLADVWQIRGGRMDYVHETAEKVSELGIKNSAARLLPKGTVIVSRTASVGFSAILGLDMATTQDFVNWVCGPRIRPEYLLYVFRSMENEFRRLTMGSTHQTIYMPDVGRFTTPLPPLDEQDAIAAYIRRETSRIDALVAKIERAIALLREHRQALITAAVTGQIDVRDEVPA